MNLSDRKVIGLLSVFTLMLVSVNCEGDEAKTNDVAADSSEPKVSFKECAQQVADEAVNHPMPEGVDELVAHVTGYFPGMKFDAMVTDEEIGKAGYKLTEHLDEACDKIDEIFEEIADKVDCIEDFEEEDIDNYANENPSFKPLVDAIRACYINGKAQYLDCDSKLDAHLSKGYKKAGDLVECVRDAEFFDLVMKKSCQEYVDVKVCMEVEKKYVETLSNVKCASKDILRSSIENYKKGTAANLLFKAVTAC